MSAKFLTAFFLLCVSLGSATFGNDDFALRCASAVIKAQTKKAELESRETKKTPEEALKLKRDASVIDTSRARSKINIEGTGAEGAFNFGVFSVYLVEQPKQAQTPHESNKADLSNQPKPPAESKPVALKIADIEGFQSGTAYESPVIEVDGRLQFSQHFLNYLWIHEVLGELGLAPEILGFIPPREMKAYAEKNEIRIMKGAGTIGILMEEIPGAWNFMKHKDEGVPAVFGSWSAAEVAAIAKRMRLISAVLDALGLRGHDLQYLISLPNKTIHLIDIDSYEIQSPVLYSNECLNEIRRLIFLWEKASGQKFPDKEKSELLSPFLPHERTE